MSAPRGRLNFKVLSSRSYPNPYDILSKEVGQNVIRSVQILEQRRGGYLEAIAGKVEKTQSKKKKVSTFKNVQQHNPRLALFEMASSLPTTCNTKYIDRAIWNKLSCRGLEKIYQNTFWDLVEEVRAEFIKATHAVGVICVIKPPTESIPGHQILAPHKHLGRTLFYPTYRKIIDRFNIRLIPTFRLMRKILALCVQDLPECLFSLKIYRDKAYNISELEAIFDELIDKSKTVIRTWYKLVVESVQKDKSKFPNYLKYQIYTCGTTLMGTFLTLSIRNTIELILEITKNDEEIPFLTMKMCYANKIVLQPPINELCHLYIRLIRRLSTIANDLKSLEAYHCEGYSNKVIPIFIPPDLLDHYEKQAKHNVVMLFSPVNLYVKTLNTEFAVIYLEEDRWERLTTFDSMDESQIVTVKEVDELISFPDTLRKIERILPEEEKIGTQQTISEDPLVLRKTRSLSKPLEQFTFSEVATSMDLEPDLQNLGGEHHDLNPVKQDISFEQGYATVKTYKSYLDKLRVMIDIEHYLVGQLFQSSCRDDITNTIYDMIQKVADRLVLQHVWLNEDICEQFEMIKMRALTIPKTSEELMELGAYMTWAANDYLEDLTERIESSLDVTIHLLEMTTLTTDHMKLNRNTIAWLDDIKVIFEENTNRFEALKTDFDDRLQRSISQLVVDIETFFPSLQIINFMDDTANCRTYIQQLAPFMAVIKGFDSRLSCINREEVVFKYPLTQISDLKETKQHLFPFHTLVKVCFSLTRYTNAWLYGPFEFLDPSKAEAIIDEIFKELMASQKSYKNKIRQAASENLRLQFTGVLDDPDPLTHPAPLKLCSRSLQTIQNFRPALKMMTIMCNDALLQRHWDEMSEVAGFDITPNAGTTLDKFMHMGILDEIEKYEMISISATKERQLLRNLLEMQSEWDLVLFKIGTYEETEINVLIGLDDIQLILDEHIVKTVAMRGSVFVKPYISQVRSWYEKIVRCNATIDEWRKVQLQWLNLLPIFSSQDIVKQMTEERVLFQEINSIIQRYVNVIIKDPKVIDTASQPQFLENLLLCTGMLERINEGVANYLENKRLYFPRFFFLSNAEILEILSETKDPLRVQSHLKKCFVGINKLEFDECFHIHAMFSEESERIAFTEVINTVAARGSVEKWLLQVEAQMLVTIARQLRLSWIAYQETPRIEWVTQWPGQVVLAISKSFWTLNMHRVLNSCNRNDGKQFLADLENDLFDAVTLIRSSALTNFTRFAIKALILTDVHAKDVTEDLLNKNVKNDKEFKWLAQLRYYWEERCMVRIINATIKYCNEYLGNNDRLVITPLTERCYRTLIGAYYLHLNGAPEGPAGTGKSETIKDLAKAIAVKCIVFNCSDGLHYKTVGKLFKGLVSSGAWACFDEFDRIHIEVLSVVAQQMLSITLALKSNVQNFVFEGTELTLNPTCFVCITINPSYAGRTELPDNLKTLFRTIAMMKPNFRMIAEMSLYSYGFKDAKKLSVKIVTIYRWCSEQLSSQSHYDCGIRSVKSVIKACENNKVIYPDEDEDTLLFRAILDVNIPKLLNYDVSLFEGITSDLFPGIILPEIDYSPFILAIQKSFQNMNLQVKQCVLTKILQTYEIMKIRHGFILIGEPFSGKTVTLKVLADSLTNMEGKEESQVPLQYQFINPKSITLKQLYGQFDPISYEWFDGVFVTCFRNLVMDSRPERKWIIFDGPIDAIWIENLNSVLDDNKKLCLMSGEILIMTKSMSMIFEVMDLSQASPATISRCGMIYMEPGTIGWRAHVESWLPLCCAEWREGNEEYILELFDWAVPAGLCFIRKNCHQLCNSGEINLVRNMMQIMDMTITEGCNDPSKKDEDLKYMRGWIQGAIVTGMMWGLGSILDQPSRDKFDIFTKTLWRGENEDHCYPSVIEKLEILIPESGVLFDFSFVFRGKGIWKFWPDVIKSMKVDEGRNVQQMLIPTIDSVKYMNLVEMHLRRQLPILLIGPSGIGKSFYLQDLLMNRLDPEKYEPALITFTIAITANQTQDLIISKLEKRKRDNYGPPKGKLGVIFVDDLNMPVKEIYGTQPPIELLRQYCDHKNWYDVKNANPIYLNDILIIAAMGIPGGSRQEIYSRFLRHFSIFSINDFSNDTMCKIYSNVLLFGWKNNGFPSDIIQTVHQVVNATLDIYKSTLETLLPTPTKSHYIFNLRDFSRIICGCAMLRKVSVDNKTMFPKVWVHEVLRVLYDRLVDAVDKEWLYTKLRNSVEEFFKESFDKVFDTLVENNEEVTELSLHKLMFGTFLDTTGAEDGLKYEEVVALESFTCVANKALDDYNSSNNIKMDIVLFTYALQHLSKICRILSIPGGSTLLVGVSGSGRQTLTRIATTMAGYSLFQPEITSNYGMTEWREHLKSVVKEAGGKGKHTVFLFTEGQLKEEGFLQDIDGLLNAGEVPNIFAVDEKQEVLEMVRLAAQGGNRNLDISPHTTFSFFIKRTRENLHIILCFSPIGSLFRTRLRMYPSFVNCCTIDWFEDWPEDALEGVAHTWMAELNLSDDVKESVIAACKHFHISAKIISSDFCVKTNRKTYITSPSYLALIKAFTELTNIKQHELTNNKRRYLVGLEKLQFAVEQIALMQNDMDTFEPELKFMTDRAIVMMAQIEKETIEVAKASNLVRKDEEIANAQAAEAQALKKECEADLALAIPILEEAIDSLNTLKPTDITLVKSMKNPPEPIKLVMAAVCVIKGVKPDRLPDPSTGRKIIDFWGPSKRILGDMNFLQSLKDFDKDHIKPEIMAKIRKDYLLHKDFKPHIVAKASSAAEGLCKWIIAMDIYDKVAKEVAPKKAKLEEAEKKYAATMAILFEKKQQVARLEQKLADLNHMLEEATAKKASLQSRVDLCGNKLLRANQLISGLGGEKTRWIAAANKLQDQYDTVAGDILLSCGLMSYLSPFPMNWRVEAISEWFKFIQQLCIPTSSTFDFTSVLGTDIKTQNWYIAGLPRDGLSTENAIIQDNSKRWSLLIDPQNQANLWIKKMEEKNELHVTQFSDGNYMNVIEYCLQTGKPVLIENIAEDLEAPLDPILLKSTFLENGVTVISLGDLVLPYNSNFKLFLTSKIKNPHYPPEVYNKVTVINFVLMLTGLEDQLLGIVVAKERPDLHRKREELIIENAENKTALANVEETILRTLSESQDDILEDEIAIHTLNRSKLTSIDIITRQIAAKETEAKIELYCWDYKEVSVHSSGLYHCISDLPIINSMYQFSIGWFINLFTKSINTANRSRELEKRLNYLKENFTCNLYENVCRSLFEKDKLMFSFLLCVQLMMSRCKINEPEYVFLITGGVDTDNLVPNPGVQWLNSKSWNEICRLDEFVAFRGIQASFVDNVHAWKKIYDLTEPHNESFPDSWDSKLSHFQKLLIIRVLRPDKIHASISNYVAEEMGTNFSIPPTFNIAKSFETSNCLTPLVFILSPGTDPMSALQNFAFVSGYRNKLKCISLGQGQGPLAQALVEQGQKEGYWVCLQNCHLAESWMVSLEKLVENLDVNNTHMNFRLWLTTNSTDKFPVVILQNGVKMINEPPTGLQQHLLRSYINDPIKNEAFYTGCPGSDVMFARLLYGIAFFHAVVQERKNFGPLGWNVPYAFNETDFDMSVQQLQIFINEYGNNSYDGAYYLIGECNYGGRVTDYWDRRLIVTLLNDYIKPEAVTNLNYSFSDVAYCYNIPRKPEYDYLIDHIRSLPQFHPPEVYGLHNNAGIIKDSQLSNLLLNSLMVIQGKVITATNEEEARLIASDIISKLPTEFDLEKTREKYPLLYEEILNTVLVHEIERFTKLLNEIRNSLLTILKVIKGTAVMIPSLEELQNSLLQGKIPATWAKVSYPSLKSLPDYIADFIERIEFCNNWFKHGKPVNFWLSGFFFIQGFLSGVKQNYSRKHKIPIDQLTFDFEILREASTSFAPEDGVFVYGLHMVGGRWDVEQCVLAELLPRVYHDYMPLIWLKPILASDYNEFGRYKCPLYNTSDRRGVFSATGHSTNYVLPFLLNSTVPPSHWVKRSVALLCQLD